MGFTDPETTADPVFRYEIKYELSLRGLMRAREQFHTPLMALDPHAAAAGQYRVHSLYFDTPDDRALREKENGTNPRSKFRIRCYDDCVSGRFHHLHLEKKMKWNGLGRKISVPLAWEEVDAILSGNWDWHRYHMDPPVSPGGPTSPYCGEEAALLEEFHRNITAHTLIPKAVVDYIREPYLYAPCGTGGLRGHVRLTLDTRLRRGISCRQFLEYSGAAVPVGGVCAVMEVKWDAAPAPPGKRSWRTLLGGTPSFLPDDVRKIIRCGGGQSAVGFSKYAWCRMYG